MSTSRLLNLINPFLIHFHECLRKVRHYIHIERPVNSFSQKLLNYFYSFIYTQLKIIPLFILLMYSMCYIYILIVHYDIKLTGSDAKQLMYSKFFLIFIVRRKNMEICSQNKF